ncbi:MAG: hypothetical protein GYB66_04160 [Chloroflexi bacterium]|nr:hypothetical protein [Chloroflexota bacterium]
MEENEIRELLKAGIEAAKSNNKIIARGYLRRVLDQDPTNETALLWMAQASDQVAERRSYLEQVLAINPNQPQARAALEKIREAMGETFTPGADYGGDDYGLGGLRQSALRGDTEPEERLRGGGQQRDWFEPVQRENLPPGLWSNRRAGAGWSLTMLLVGAIAVVFIGIAGFLLYDYIQNQEDEDDNDEVAAADTNATETQNAIATASASPSTPTNTPRPTSPLLGTPTSELPPPLEPTATYTPTPTATWTPTPNPPELYNLVFASSEIAREGDPYRLFIVDGDGQNLAQLTVTLPDNIEIELSEPATEEPPEVVEETPAAPEEGEVEGEGEGATEEPVITPTATMLPPQDLRQEFISPEYSPDGEFIVFTAQIGQVHELFVMPVDGGTARQLTVLGGTETGHAAWSPDGSQIAFSSNASGNFDLYLVAADGSGPPVPLASINTDSEELDPDWAPDGQHIVFASDRAGAGELEIFVAPLQSDAGICRMTNASGSSFAPEWSPDGTSIVFISNRTGDNDLYIMRSSGAGETLITVSDGEWEDEAPAWSPDGEWIALSSTRVGPASEFSVSPTSKIWLVTPNGDTWRQVTTGESDDTEVDWLPGDVEIDISDFEFECAVS